MSSRASARADESGRRFREDPDLLRQPYFHGFLPRDDVQELLAGRGAFLVRTTEPKAGQPREYVLSLRTEANGNSKVS